MQRVFTYAHLLLLTGLLLAAGAAQAQDSIPDQLSRQVIASEGNTPIVNGWEFSYTIGQPATTTAVGFGGVYILTQGFQQPDSIEVYAVSLDDGIIAYLDCRLWPNPTVDLVNLSISSDRQVSLRAGIYNALGQPIGIPEQSLDLRAPREVSFDLTRLAEGNYYLILKSETGRTLQAFKVQKR